MQRLVSPVYTIEDARTRRPFALSKVVVFRSYPAAHFVARAVEHRNRVLGTILERGAWADLNALVPAPFVHKTLEHLRIVDWEDARELVDVYSDGIFYCTDVAPRGMCHPIEFRLADL